LSLVKTRDDDVFRYPHDLLSSDDAPPAVEVLRQVLAKSVDHSITLVQVGLAANLADLLESPPDAISPLGGVELVQRKVRFLSVMAGEFAAVHGGDHFLDATVKDSIDSMQRLADQWPNHVPVDWSAYLIAFAAAYPRQIIARDFSFSQHH